MSELENFAEARVFATEFLLPQRASIQHFWDGAKEVFFRTDADRSRGDSDGGTQQPANATIHKVRRLTSTVTCIESLLEAPDWFGSQSGNWTHDEAKDILATFMRKSLSTTDGWKSDGAAWVYSRVRTLGSALRLLSVDEWNAEEMANARELLKQAWASHQANGGNFGLQELTAKPGSEEASARSDQQYPANAYLTYWGLLAATLLEESDSGESGLVSPPDREAAESWLSQNLAIQIGLHYANSRHADPQQLLWSLCGLIRFGAVESLQNRTSVEYELLVAGLRAFFEQQDRGTWERGAPLFHFRNAGNAYSYIYEALGELLSLATSREIMPGVAESLSAALKPHSAELYQALGYAVQTRQPLGQSMFGWSSGHHPHRLTAESWATASVYRFGQAFRRLLGIWSREAAEIALGARRASGNLRTFTERGGTWDLGRGTAGAFLTTAFVHPVNRVVQESETKSRFLPDPDERILGEDQARSAMLFGPPGTGKTKLVEAIAGSLGWAFVEITPAHFLDRGVDHVSARADEIFRQVMELDHAVVLLDEIDELIQSRSKEAETLERFFTTTMLPRLAKLWDARRVLFFVNTNNIHNVDSAIVRSQRFDAALLVLPPGYAAKRDVLLAKTGCELEVSDRQVRDALLKPDSVLPGSKPAGWLALVRYDQMAALASELNGDEAAASQDITVERLVHAIGRVAQELSRLDWRDGYKKNEDGTPDIQSENGIPQLPNVLKQFEAERRDSRMKLYALLDGNAIPAGIDLTTTQIGDRTWVLVDTSSSPEAWAEKHGGTLSPAGVLSFPEEARANAT